MTSVMKDISPEYYDDPAARPITLSFETSDDRTLDEIGLCTALTMLFHSITKYRRENVGKRTGKPEAALEISYHPPRGASEALNAICEEYSSYIDASTTPRTYHLYAADFWQRRHCINDILWPTSPVPQRMISTGSSRHPIRPLIPPQGTLIYRRFIPTFMTCFSLRVISIATQLDLYASWQDSERVNNFWGERGPREAHEAYLERQLSDKHVLPVMGYFGDSAFAYFEIYYAKEDHIAVHASARDWDRGFHALVGDDDFRGPERVRIWISSLTHYLFLADERTQRVMLEPRVDNRVFIEYLLKSGYVIEKEFNFPHKRAALVSITREKFFECQGVET